MAHAFGPAFKRHSDILTQPVVQVFQFSLLASKQFNGAGARMQTNV